MVQVRLLGGLVLEDSSGTPMRLRTRKTAALLAYLAYYAGRAHPREVLADRFWPDATSDASRQSLRMALSDIRKSAPGFLSADRETVEVTEGSVVVDAAEFRKLARAGDSLALTQAMELYSGPLLDGVEEDWVTPQRTALEEEFAQVVVRLMGQCGKSGEFSQGLAFGKRALALVGTREDIHVGLIRLYAQSGTPSLAIAQYEELERALDEEWGEQPSDIARQALESVPRGVAVAPPAPTFSAPTGKIFGREEALAHLATHVLDTSESRFVTLHGPAGSGKTTLGLHLATRLSKHFPGRCWVIDLTPCGTADALPTALAEALGVQGIELGSRLAACIHVLHEKPSFLVLDNMEHLLPEGANAVRSLLGGAPELRIVVTSRRVVELEGEHVVAVPPLATSAADASLEEVRQSPAVQMFCARATAANPAFRLTPDNARSVVALCDYSKGCRSRSRWPRAGPVAKVRRRRWLHCPAREATFCRVPRPRDAMRALNPLCDGASTWSHPSRPNASSRCPSSRPRSRPLTLSHCPPTRRPRTGSPSS